MCLSTLVILDIAPTNPLHSTRVHPKVPVIDILVPVELLGYIQHPTKVLKEIKNWNCSNQLENN